MDGVESKICPECGKEFFRTPEDKIQSWKVRKYCCKECSDKHNRHLKGRVLRICENCGKEYMARDFLTSTGCYQRFCTVECQHEAARKRKQAFQERC